MEAWQEVKSLDLTEEKKDITTEINNDSFIDKILNLCTGRKPAM